MLWQSEFLMAFEILSNLWIILAKFGFHLANGTEEIV